MSVAAGSKGRVMAEGMVGWRVLCAGGPDGLTAVSGVYWAHLTWCVGSGTTVWQLDYCSMRYSLLFNIPVGQIPHHSQVWRLL